MVLRASLFDPSLFEEYLENKRGLKYSSITKYRICIDKFLSLNPDLENLEDYNNFLIESVRRKKSKYYYSIIKIFVEWKISELNLRRKIVEGLIKPKDFDSIKRQRKHLTDDKLIEVINNLVNEKHRIMAIIQTMTGIRAGDVLRLKEGSIVPEEYKEKAVLRLNIDGKGDKQSRVHIFDEVAQQLIMDYITLNTGVNGYYFIDMGQKRKKQSKIDNEYLMVRMNYEWYVTDLKQALELAGVNRNDFATHDFRRCFARNHWEKYKDMEKLKRILNHAEVSTTLRYLKQSGLDTIDMFEEMQR